jgi:uncharacterized membrane protein YdbT with pleckstrin-like domain
MNDMDNTTNSEEKTIWEGSPSQWMKTGQYAAAAGIAAAVIVAAKFTNQWWFCWTLLYPAGKILWNWLSVRAARYQLTDSRLIIREGVFKRVTKEIQLSRIEEVTLIEPWYKRFVGLGDIQLNPLSRYETDCLLSGIAEAEKVKELFNQTIKETKKNNA